MYNPLLPGRPGHPLIIHRFLYLLVCLLLTSGRAIAQTPDANGCFTRPLEDANTALRPIPNANCDPVSAAYNNFFRKKESYRPINGEIEPVSVVKKIKMRFVVINPDPNAAEKWNFLPADTPILRRIVDTLNKYAANLALPTKPSPTCGTCHITDERIRFELTDIDFITDTTNYWVDSTNHFIHGKYQDSILNYYLIVNRNFHDTGLVNGHKIYESGGIAFDGLGRFSVSAGNDFIHRINHTNFYLSSYTISKYRDTWRTFDDCLLYEAGRMFHELHHVMGLHHLYDAVTCDPTDPEYLSDIFSGNTITCHLDNDNCDAYDPSSNCTNNTMSRLGWYVSPMQIGQVHRSLFIGTTKSYCYPTEAPSGHPWNVYSDETWDFAIRMYQDIHILPGATLTVKCEIQMPPGGKILVYPGAKLIVDGGIITSYHGRSTWLGIQAMGSMTQPSAPQYQGSVEIKNGAIIENAKEALQNFSPQNGYQGGGIIKAENSFFYNNWRSVALNGYGDYSYGNVFSGATNCSFDNVEFTIDEYAPFLEFHNWNGGDQFTSFNTKSGVLIKNCKFNNNIPGALQPQDKRGRAIHMAVTGILVSNTYFYNFKTGISSEGYAPITTCTNYIYDNTFKGNTTSISLSAQAYGDIRGNKISSMNGYTNGRAVGIFLDNTLGSFVGCNNTIDGSGGSPGLLGNIGAVINNISRFEAASVIRNRFTNLTRATQTQRNNEKLDILCNQYENNGLALCINPESVNGSLKDQGNGCDPNTQYRAGNTFTGNTRDITCYLNNNPGDLNNIWDYYYFYSSPGGSTDQVPNTVTGYMSPNGCNFGTATADPNSQCNKLMTCIRYSTGVKSEHNQAKIAYANFVASGKKQSSDAAILRAQVIRGYGLLDDEPGLRTFLENENDDNADRLLIPLYINAGNYSGAITTISNLSVSASEKNAYNDYYGLLINLKQHNRDITMLDMQEQQVIRTLAASDFEVAPYAKATLDWAGIEPWEHKIEEEPGIPVPRPGSATEQQQEESRLDDAIPNPANSNTMITVYIAAKDMAGRPELILLNMAGEAVGQYNLVKGENKIEINTGSFPAGLYMYSMTLRGEVIRSKKLSIVK